MATVMAAWLIFRVYHTERAISTNLSAAGGKRTFPWLQFQNLKSINLLAAKIPYSKQRMMIKEVYCLTGKPVKGGDTCTCSLFIMQQLKQLTYCASVNQAKLLLKACGKLIYSLETTAKAKLNTVSSQNRDVAPALRGDDEVWWFVDLWAKNCCESEEVKHYRRTHYRVYVCFQTPNDSKWHIQALETTINQDCMISLTCDLTYDLWNWCNVC